MIKGFGFGFRVAFLIASSRWSSAGDNYNKCYPCGRSDIRVTVRRVLSGC